MKKEKKCLSPSLIFIKNGLWTNKLTLHGLVYCYMFGMIGNETFIVLIDFNDIPNHETRMLDMYIYILIFQDEGQCVFSSPGLKGNVSFCHHFASVSVNFSYFHLLLWNHWTDLDQTWQKCSLGGLPSDLLFWCRSEIQLWKSSCHKIPSRWNCNIIEMMSVWSSTKFVIFVPIAYPRWPPWLDLV